MFSVEHAVEYGMAEAAIIYNLQFWIVRNRANGENLRDGRTWTYNSIASFATLFPYLSIKQIRGALVGLVREGVLLTGNFNEKATDRTLWYAFADEKTFVEPVPSQFPDRENAFTPKGAMHLPAAANAVAAEGNSLIRADAKPDGKPDVGRGSRLPKDWVLIAKWAKEAIAIYPNWTPDHIRFEGEKFRDHWHAQAGRHGVKLDWLATWRNWVRNSGAMRVERGGAGAQWWHSEPDALAEARRNGLGPANAGESKEAWHGRIREAIANGGRPPAPRAPTPIPSRADQAAPARSIMSDEARAGLFAALKPQGATQ